MAHLEISEDLFDRMTISAEKDYRAAPVDETLDRPLRGHQEHVMLSAAGELAQQGLSGRRRVGLRQAPAEQAKEPSPAPLPAPARRRHLNLRGVTPGSGHQQACGQCASPRTQDYPTGARLR